MNLFRVIEKMPRMLWIYTLEKTVYIYMVQKLNRSPYKRTKKLLCKNVEIFIHRAMCKIPYLY